jgi:hypothetical protein
MHVNYDETNVHQILARSKQSKTHHWSKYWVRHQESVMSEKLALALCLQSTSRATRRLAVKVMDNCSMDKL